jgi:anaerobic ribonucleoside-triphosphate reductase
LTFSEESLCKPLLSPKLIIKINSTALADVNAKATLLKAHQLAAKSGILYFANMTKKENENVAFSSSGVKFAPDLTGDWETDTLRTGCLGCVTINMPRIGQECDKDKNKFFDLMRERFELAARALTHKEQCAQAIREELASIPVAKSDRDTYFRLENCSSDCILKGFRKQSKLHRKNCQLGGEPQIHRRNHKQPDCF